MPTIIKKEQGPKKRDYQKGLRLQKQAEKLREHGETGPAYRKLRSSAEYHLGMWLWQEKHRNFGKIPTSTHRSQTDAMFPRFCLNRGCPHLPAGSADCVYYKNWCPDGE